MSNSISKGKSDSSQIIIGIVAAYVYLLSVTGISILTNFFQIEPSAFFGELIVLFGFLIVAILIFCGSKTLPRYFLDRYSLLIILIFPGFFNPVSVQKTPWLTYFFILLPIAISTFLFFRIRKQSTFRDGNIQNLAKYLFLGTAIALFFYLFVTIGGYRSSINDLSQLDIHTILIQFLIKFSTSPTFEETIFRGFLLGHLINDKQIRPIYAIAFQALLFWIPHLYKLNNPIPIQLSVLLFGVCVGWTTYKTKNITTGIIAHAIYNALIALG